MKASYRSITDQINILKTAETECSERTATGPAPFGTTMQTYVFRSLLQTLQGISPKPANYAIENCPHLINELIKLNMVDFLCVDNESCRKITFLMANRQDQNRLLMNRIFSNALRHCADTAHELLATYEAHLNESSLCDLLRVVKFQTDSPYIQRCLKTYKDHFAMRSKEFHKMDLEMIFDNLDPIDDVPEWNKEVAKYFRDQIKSYADLSEA